MHKTSQIQIGPPIEIQFIMNQLIRRIGINAGIRQSILRDIFIGPITTGIRGRKSTFGVGGFVGGTAAAGNGE